MEATNSTYNQLLMIKRKNQPGEGPRASACPSWMAKARSLGPCFYTYCMHSLHKSYNGSVFACIVLGVIGDIQSGFSDKLLCLLSSCLWLFLLI